LRSADPAIRFVMPQRLIQSDAPNAMKLMQIRLNQPAIGHLTACSGGKTLWGDFIQSRPERRILAPLFPMLQNNLTTAVELKILRNPSNG